MRTVPFIVPLEPVRVSVSRRAVPSPSFLRKVPAEIEQFKRVIFTVSPLLAFVVKTMPVSLNTGDVLWELASTCPVITACFSTVTLSVVAFGAPSFRRVKWFLVL